MIINQKLRKKSSIVCSCTTNTNSTSTSAYTAVPLSQAALTGDKLKLDSNKIVAEKDCIVIVSAQIYITAGVSATTTGVTIAIRKNGSVHNRAVCPIPNNWRMAQISGVEVRLNAGDYIDLAFYSGDKTGITCGTGADSYIAIIEL